MSRLAGGDDVALRLLPTTDGTASRTVFIDGLATVATNVEPPAVDLNGATASSEYATPATR